MTEKKKFPSIEEMHREWEIQCLPPDAPTDQHIEMQKAFMCGAFAMFKVLADNAADFPEDEALRNLDAMLKQFETYFSETIYKL